MNYIGIISNRKGTYLDIVQVVKQCCGTDGVESQYIREEILPEFFRLVMVTNVVTIITIITMVTMVTIYCILLDTIYFMLVSISPSYYLD